MSSISKLQTAFQASLESDEIKVDEEFADLGEIIEAEDEMIAAEEAIGEVEDAEEITEGLDEVAEGLESICAYMEASLENGGLEPGEAAALAMAVESYAGRLGLQNGLMASMESFGGSSDRVAATQISMEAVKDTIKKIWQAIKNAVAKAIRAVADFFAKLYKGVDRLVARNEALMKEVEGLGDKKAEANAKIKVPGADVLHVGGKLDASAIIGGIDGLKSLLENQSKAIVEGAADYYTSMGKVVTDKKTLDAEEESAVEAALAKAGEGAAKIFEKIKGRTKEAAGGVYLESSAEQGASEGSKRLQAPVMKRAGKATGAAGAEIAVLTPAQMTQVLKGVKGVLDVIQGKKKQLDELKKARESAVKSFDEFVKAGERNALGKAWTQARVNVVLRSANRDLARPVNQLCSHGFSVSRAAQALVARSVAAYK